MKRRWVFSICLIFCALVFFTSGCKTSGESGNENNTDNTTSPYKVIIYNSAKAFNGTTLFTDSHEKESPGAFEVNMKGEIIWEYRLPDNLKNYTQPGFDVELLSSGNILLVLPGYGILEINRSGTILWEYKDNKISHDADRLSNGNTLYNFGNSDEKNDPQAKEVDSDGNFVWSWRAATEYDKAPYNSISNQGWTHANAVIRLPNGNTIISLRNFNLTVEVNSSGKTVWEMDWSVFGTSVDPHEPEVLNNGNILVCLQRDSPYQAVEIEKTTKNVIWTYGNSNLRTTRDADRLPNGNTLLVTVDTSVAGHESLMIEVTPSGEIVWEMRLSNVPVENSPGYFFKAQRLPL